MAFTVGAGLSGVISGVVALVLFLTGILKFMAVYDIFDLPNMLELF